VNQATPTVTWSTPAAITYGTALSGTQLNASSTVAGTFTYSPAAGTVLNAGTQTLAVSFAPTDTTDYKTASDQRHTYGEQSGVDDFLGHARAYHIRHGAERNAARCQLDGGRNLRLFTNGGDGAVGWKPRVDCDPDSNQCGQLHDSNGNRHGNTNGEQGYADDYLAHARSYHLWHGA
jgi:hypothetical protein